MLSCEAGVFWQGCHVTENSALPKTFFLVCSLWRCHQVLSYFTPLPTPNKYCPNLTIMQPFFCREYLLKHLIPELWNVDKSTLTWLSYFLSFLCVFLCVFFLTHILSLSTPDGNYILIHWIFTKSCGVLLKFFFYPFHQMSWLIPHSFIPAFNKLHF